MESPKPYSEQSKEQIISDYEDYVTESRKRIAELETWKAGALADFETIAHKAKTVLDADDTEPLLDAADRAMIFDILSIATIERSLSEAPTTAKFKVGDKVRVIVKGFSDEIRVITEVHLNGLYKVNTPSISIGSVPFWENELEPYTEEITG
jgi:transcription antitermination factor NusG